jgi:hypothetical protein
MHFQLLLIWIFIAQVYYIDTATDFMSWGLEQYEKEYIEQYEI